MRKRIYFILILLLSFVGVRAQNVGINTATPTRNLDVNGNLRIGTLLDKTNDSNYKNIIVADTDGNLDVWDKSNLKDKIQNVILENKKITYISNSGTLNQSMDCGRFSLRFNAGGIPQIKLVSGNSTTVFYTVIHKTNSSGSSFASPNTLTSMMSVTIGSGTNVNTNGWQRLDANYTNNVLDEIYISYPGDNNLYRITFLARNSSSTNYYYTMICEKY